MGGIAFDIGFELGRHGADDALAHAGGTRVDLDIEADALDPGVQVMVSAVVLNSCSPTPRRRSRVSPNQLWSCSPPAANSGSSR